MTFTITQTPDSAIFYSYPTSDYAVSHVTYGAVGNWECVNDNLNEHNDDTDYVQSTATTIKYDYFNIEDHTTQSGVINFLRCHVRGRAVDYIQGAGGYFQPVFLLSGTTYFGTNAAPIDTSYRNYTYTETDVGGAFTWGDIDDILLGFRTSSPSTTKVTTVVFRPDGNGSNTEWTGDYTDVDEVVLDTGDYIEHGWLGAGEHYESFDIEDTSQTGTIHYIDVKMVARKTQAGNTWAHLMNYISSTTYSGDKNYLSTDWVTYTYRWETNPDTSIAWIWGDIDGLEIGVKGFGNLSSKLQVAQIWTEVCYDAPVNPEIRVTQCYLEVNYNPPSSTVTLNTPANNSVSHSRNLSRFTFSDGVSEVHDFGRGGKTLTMNGFEYSTATATMQTLKDMTHYQQYVTVAGLPDTNLNGNYWIRDFNYEMRGGEPTIYHWDLVLEEA